MDVLFFCMIGLCFLYGQGGQYVGKRLKPVATGKEESGLLWSDRHRLRKEKISNIYMFQFSGS